MNLPSCLRPCSILWLAASIQASAASPILVSSRTAQLPPEVTGSGPSSGGVFVGPSTEAGPRHVVFLSGAGNLVDRAIPAGVVNVFRRDRVEQRTELLSLTSEGGVGSRPVLEFSATPGGEHLVFAWASPDGPAGDTNVWEDVYLREVPAGVTRLVSVRADGSGPGNGPSAAPGISADGRFVVFESLATDLVSGEDTNQSTDVFLRNLETGVTERLSTTTEGRPGHRPSREPLINGDGSRVVFLSESLDLAPLAGYGTDLWVWTRGAGSLTRVTLPGDPPSAFRGPVIVANPVLSADGRYLAFSVASLRFDQFPSGVWWMDLDTGVLQRASGELPVAGVDVPEPVSLSANGRALAFTVLVEAAGSNLAQVRIWTPEGGLKTLEELRLTVPPTAGEPAVTFQPVLSPAGNSVLFFSDVAVPDAGVPEGGEARLYHRDLATGRTRLIAGEEVLFAGGISSDGKTVLWETADPLFEPGDANDILDVVVTRLEDGKREVVSLALPPMGPLSAHGISTSGNGISDDGRFLAFLSTAGDLVAGDTNGYPDGFLFDASQPGSLRITASPDESAPVARPRELVLSRSGRFVAFVTASRGWTTGDTNDLADVYVRDLVLGTTELVSARDGTDQSLDQAAADVRISADGQWVSFRTIPPPDQPQNNRLYLRHRANRQTELVNSTPRTGSSVNVVGSHELSADGQVLLFRNGFFSWIHHRGSPELFSVGQSFSPAWLSPDGRRVAFGATSNAMRGIWVRAVRGGGDRLILPSPQDAIRDLAFSADGSVLTYCRRSNASGPPAGNPWQVWAMAVATGDEELVSVSPSGAHGSEDSREPRISADGRFIVYRTQASNLLPDGAGTAQDVVVRDRYRGVNRRLSATTGGGPGNNRSSRPEISGDGRMAAFSSAASDLVAGDGNGLEDVFLVAIPRDLAPDEDRDGLPDGWEEDHFGTRSRDGSGDADGDGSTDAEEWVARTSPTDADSRWLVHLELAEDTRRMRWRGAAGTAYQVERSDVLAPGAWRPVGSPLTGYEGNMSATLGGEFSAGFFRVVASRP